jgi:hypothetical protein
MIGHALSDTMVPSEGGPDRPVGWIRVPRPLPLEIDRSDGGVYVLDDRQAGPVYVYLRM